MDHNTVLITLNVVVLLGEIALGVLLKTYLPAYATEKGKNLATKEDIGEITHLVERVRAHHMSDTERLKADLTRAINMHRARYEMELGTYREIWDHLVEVQRTALNLRPVMDIYVPDEKERQERNRARLADFGEKFNAFTAVVYKRRSFYPQTVFNELMELAKLARGEAIGFQYGDSKGSQDYWKEARANAERIADQVNKLCEVMRQRLEEYDA